MDDPNPALAGVQKSGLQFQYEALVCLMGDEATFLVFGPIVLCD